MSVLASLASFVEAVETIETGEALEAALEAVAAVLDCTTYLLFAPDAQGTQRMLHKRDAVWLTPLAADIADGIRRAAMQAPRGFAWRKLALLVRPTQADRQLLHQAHRHGVRAAITVPIFAPGGQMGSCTFATSSARDFSSPEFMIAAILVPSLWHAARRILMASRPEIAALTSRQRECVLWAARGKTDWEIGQILSVGEDTVNRHLRQARERYRVDKRSTLIVHALFDGTVSFEEALELRYSPFPE